MKTIGAKIRFFRHLRELKQVTVAELLEVDVKTYQNYETNNADVSYSRLCQIAKVFNVPIYDLVGVGEVGYKFQINF